MAASPDRVISMDKDISFGDFRETQPKLGIAPDRNPHFAVAWVGESASELPIFVDLDVMRELETHALDNINVELGGVLLGVQQVDSEGRPFVVVQDSLRAEHYEATRGSFKFTHETWEAITRQRDQFPEPFVIVGWYHTHPGWGVFLSDMDMFICNHFFNRPLDVALVIDPVRDDRGWFTWSQDAQPATKRHSAGFGLFAHRQREEELESVVQYYNERANMSADPRLRITKQTPAAPTVTWVERPQSPLPLIAAAALILGQLMLITAVLWRSPPATTTSTTPSTQTQLDLLLRERQAQAKSDAYREALIAAVEKTPETSGLVDRFAQVNTQNQSLQSSLDGQAALTRELKQQLNRTTEQLGQMSIEQKNLGAELDKRDATISALQTRLDGLVASGATPAWTTSTWVLAGGGAIIGILAAAAGVVAGFALARRRDDSDTSAPFSADDSEGLGDDSKMKLA